MFLSILVLIVPFMELKQILFMNSSCPISVLIVPFMELKLKKLQKQGESANMS